jgi:hypothetical protein
MMNNTFHIVGGETHLFNDQKKNDGHGHGNSNDMDDDFRDGDNNEQGNDDDDAMPRPTELNTHWIWREKEKTTSTSTAATATAVAYEGEWQRAPSCIVGRSDPTLITLPPPNDHQMILLSGQSHLKDESMSLYSFYLTFCSSLSAFMFLY